jgi:hypothetical protein
MMEVFIMICEYGCGQEAAFKTSNGKDCCSVRYNGCPAVKAKNAAGLKKAHAEGRMPDNQACFKGKQGWNKGLFTADFAYDGKGNHKQVLLQERGHTCESCKLDTWLGQPIALELEHVDGDTKNNVTENLKLLCPNCHSQTPTWRRRKSAGGGKARYSEEVMVEAIVSSVNMHQALNKLNLKWGSSATLMRVKDRLNLKFKESPGG